MKLVRNFEKDDEYYVRKAVIWIKKNFAKARPDDLVGRGK